MTYRALYRVWRPQRFADVIGQEHITQTLQNALKERRFSHAYLFNGPRGTGKTSAAKILAKAVNCLQGPAAEPCNECVICKGMTEGSLVDVVEIDAASNRGVEEIRDVRDKVKYAPTEARYKVYIIDEVHMLTTEAFNALLKTLEEPPEHVIFILATTEPHKLPLTIISRCQRFDFRRIPVETMVERLRMIAGESGVSVSDQALMLIARAAEGGMRDALSLLDQAFSFRGETIDAEDVLTVTGSVSHLFLAETVQLLYNKNIPGIVEQLNDLMAAGKDPEQFLQDLTHYYRDLLLYKVAPQLEEVRARAMADERFVSLAESHETDGIYFVIDQLNQALAGMKWARQPRLLLEMALVRLCYAGERQNKETDSLSPSMNGAGLERDGLDLYKLRLEQLEGMVTRLQQQLAHQPASASSAKVSKVEGAGTHDSESTTSSSPRGTGGTRVQHGNASSALKIVRGRIRQVLEETSEEQLKRAEELWPEILKQVKKQKVQIQAWLRDGKPVAAGPQAIIAAFQGELHQETVEKPENKKVIEEVLHSLWGPGTQLLTLMDAQWQELRENIAGRQEAAAYEAVEADSKGEDDPFIQEAVKLVGEELIHIID